MNIHTVTSQVGSNPISFETGKMAKLADGAVLVTSGETNVLVTACSLTKIKDGQSWFPLSVEYKERAFAAGTFPGGYFKREGRPTEKEILTCRMTDRPLRPLFPKGYLYETQIVALMLSADGINDADILSMNGASAALVISDIPFARPVGAVRVGRVVIMIEGGADQIPEEEFIKALHFAQENVQKLVQAQEELKALAGKPTREYKVSVAEQDLLDVAYEVAGDRIESAIYAESKVERAQKVGALRDEVEATILERFPDTTDFQIEQAFEFLQKKAFRISILDKDKRADGRAPADLIRSW